MAKRIIGLTGGIATGKTTIANYLAKKYNLLILDADIYARDAVVVGSYILKMIVQRYGKQILLIDGNLNRKKLGDIIFHHSEERFYIENLIHPYVHDCFLEQIQQSSEKILILVVPLLFESGMSNLATEIWVVFCNRQQQLTRLTQHNQLTIEEAQVRIDSQIPLSEKINLADVVLENNLDLGELYTQIDQALFI